MNRPKTTSDEETGQVVRPPMNDFERLEKECYSLKADKEQLERELLDLYRRVHAQDRPGY